MEFIITENIRKHNFIDYAKKILLGILMFLAGFIIIIIALSAKLIEKFKFTRSKKVEAIHKNEKDWFDFLNSGKISLLRKSINENELPKNLDYPIEPADIYIFEIKSQPEIIEFKDKFFCLDTLETENGIYLVSVNELKNGMSLWFIDKVSLEIKTIKNLKSLWWNLSLKNNKIILNSNEKDKDYKIEVEEVLNK